MPGSPVLWPSWPGVVAGMLALAGAMLFLVTWRSFGRLAARAEKQRESLCRAEAGLARLAERNHELRNGIAGLAGVAEMLDPPTDESRRRVMRSAVAAELSRLDALLDGDPPGSGRCEVAEVLREVEVLWRAVGLDLRCDVSPGPQVAVPRSVLSQTMANLLTNCMRHAPGSPVWVNLWRTDGRVVVLVADRGPGLAPGTEQRVFERGGRAGSTGTGLAITRELLTAHGGDIRIDRAWPGCVVAVDLPESPAELDRVDGQPAVPESDVQCARSGAFPIA